MTNRQQIVHDYFEGFRRSDHAAILACLTDDVVWCIHGVRTTRGKAEFDDEIENPAFEGSPDLTVDRTITAGDTDLPHARLGYWPSFVAISPERLDDPTWYACNPWFCLRINDRPFDEFNG